MSVGRCKLCRRNGFPLRESHYLPKGIYRLLRDDGAKNPNPWLLTDKTSVQTSRQMTASLLCDDCEQRLSDMGENWVLARCLRKDGAFPLAATLRSREPDVSGPQTPTKVYYAAGIPEIDVAALAYFAASIFWRGSIHSWNTDGSIPVRLGPFSEAFRRYLMGISPFPTHCALVVTVREGSDVSRLTYAPIGERRGNYRLYKFPMPGLGFAIAIGKRLPHQLRRNCFVRGPAHPIVLTPLIEDFLMIDAIALIDSHPKIVSLAQVSP
jgi:hypothetical protein